MSEAAEVVESSTKSHRIQPTSLANLRPFSKDSRPAYVRPKRRMENNLRRRIKRSPELLNRLLDALIEIASDTSHRDCMEAIKLVIELVDGPRPKGEASNATPAIVLEMSQVRSAAIVSAIQVEPESDNPPSDASEGDPPGVDVPAPVDQPAP